MYLSGWKKSYVTLAAFPRSAGGEGSEYCGQSTSSRRHWAVAVSGFILATLIATSVQAMDAEEIFVRRVMPLLHEKCWACHGNDPDDIGGELNLQSLESLLIGGESGEPGLVIGKPEQSSLYLAATRTHDDWSPMPPKEADQLTAEQLLSIRDWIADGAPWPNSKRIQEIAKVNEAQWSAEDGLPMKTSGGQSAEWTNRKYKSDGLWAYRPAYKPQLSEVGSSAIDKLIQSQFPTDIAVAPPAGSSVFIRRATYDLTGLPPTPAEVAAFQSEFVVNAEAAVELLIERLLASPHYGERMAQHWLDVVRYADSSGFANDYERGNAWRYRDYVIRSFNDDKPYHEFVREQIAGDEIDANDPEKIIATGFLRMGPWELTGMEVAKVARQRFLDDVTNSVGETFLAHSLQCARCHDHKFDPIPTRDYYSVQAVFATTQLCERRADFMPVENCAGFDERKFIDRRKADYEATLAELDELLLTNAEQWFIDNQKDATRWRKAVQSSRNEPSQNRRRKYSDVFSQARNVLMQAGISEEEFPPKLVGFTPEQFGRERVARKGLERLRWELDRYEPFALAVYAGRTPDVKSVNAPTRMPNDAMIVGELEETCIHAGGDPFATGEQVQPGVLSVLDLESPPLPMTIEGRRLPFADWVANPDNALTTRAITNRIWMWHFGEPLAGNPNNFGSTGKRPTHPQLLDWLAATFVEQGWSFKSMHRIIMTSAAYRRASEFPMHSTAKSNDANDNGSADMNACQAAYAAFKPRRLTAEELRDTMLAVSGELNPELGGIPIRPEINLEAALQPRQVMGTFAAAWTPNPLPEQRHRRSIYTLKLRGLADPALEVFNAPTPDFSCERRDVSTVTPQVFSLFNSQASYTRALAMAARVLRDVNEQKDTATVPDLAVDRQVIDRCFQLAFGRVANAIERELCVNHWHEMQSRRVTNSVMFAAQPLQVRRDAVEENTGEKFSFDEQLYTNTEFVPDRQPADCDARTRALADVCLSLINANEFSYVY